MTQEERIRRVAVVYILKIYMEYPYRKIAELLKISTSTAYKDYIQASTYQGEKLRAAIYEEKLRLQV